MLGSNDNDAEFHHHDELFFRPLTMRQCWSRAYQFVFKNHFALFGKIGLSATLPFAFVILFNLTSYSYHSISGEIVEVLLLGLSITVANGPVMVATAELYAGHSRQRESHRDNDGDNVKDTSWWWYECYAMFLGLRNSTLLKRKILKKMFAGSAVAMIMVSVASIFFYIPGIYLAIRWYFVPCIILFDQTSVSQSFRRSHEATSSLPPSQKPGKFQIFCFLSALFLLEILPTVLVMIVSDVLHELTYDHFIFGGHDSIAKFFALTFYAVGTIAHKSLFVPFSIVLKTIVYLNVRIINENLTGSDFRSLLRNSDLEINCFSGGGDFNEPGEQQRSLLAEIDTVELRERKTLTAV